MIVVVSEIENAFDNVVHHDSWGLSWRGVIGKMQREYNIIIRPDFRFRGPSTSRYNNWTVEFADEAEYFMFILTWA